MKNAEKRRLLEVHYLDFFSLAMAMLRNVQDASDAVQDAMVQVLTTRSKIDDVKSYTFQSVRNAALAIMRHRQRMTSLTGDLPDSEATHMERLRQVGRLRDELPESMRALVELHDEEGYTFAELAPLTGLSVSSIRRRIDEAHEILKKRIENEI